jgi:O-antigen/teichoic acid export membrane protein
MLYPLHLLNLSVLQAMGHSSKFFRVEVVKKVVGIALLFIGSLWGVMGMAWATVVSSFLAFFFNAYYNGKYLHHGAIAQMRDIAPIGLCALPMIALVYLSSQYMNTAPSLKLAVLTAIGVATFAGTALCMRLSGLNELLDFMKSLPALNELREFIKNRKAANE